MKVWLVLLLPAAAAGHMVSMSTGEVKVVGNTAHYELRMPSYEAAHTPDPTRTFFKHIHFRSGNHEGRLLSSNCAAEKDNLVCDAVYDFSGPVDEITIDCTYPSITVPNHVHLLRAFSGDKSDQAVFDVSFTTATIRFKPPSAWEVLFRESGAGLLRAIGGLAPLLFVFGLALASRSKSELLLLAVSFLIGEVAACVAVPRLGLVLSPRFIEAAAALTIAYLAFEIVLLPDSGQRWLVVGLLGVFHGVYFSLFLAASGYSLGRFLGGVVMGQLLALAMAFAIVRTLIRHAGSARAIPLLASALMAVGLLWFAVRVWA